jgi:hypothetical protein
LASLLVLPLSLVLSFARIPSTLTHQSPWLNR